MSALTRKWLSISNLARIQPTQAEPGYPSKELFGAEPEHGWCYYFEKADLARQFADWETAAALGDEAQSKGFQPTLSGSNSAYEWQPFVEAYAHLGRWQDAANLMVKNVEFDADYAPFVCGRWKTLYNQPGSDRGRQEANQLVMEKAACAP